MRSKSSAAANARSNSSSLAFLRCPTKRVNLVLGKLANSSQWILLRCFSPSSTPTVTWVLKPSYREYTGAQTTEENFESIRTWRLTTTNTRCLRGSCAPIFVTRNKSPRCTYLGSRWNSSTSDCWLSASATRSRIAASLASNSVLTRFPMYDKAARSRKAERLLSSRSISFRRELGSVTDVLTRIPPSYTHGKEKRVACTD